MTHAQLLKDLKVRQRDISTRRDSVSKEIDELCDLRDRCDEATASLQHSIDALDKISKKLSK